jgi:uroporphyrinogen decarboxylase
MTNRERVKAILNYQKYDRLPLVHFGYWDETLELWSTQGHITREQAKEWRDGNEVDRAISAKLGFDFNWQTMFYTNHGPRPPFERQVIKEFPDGSKHVRNSLGVVTVEQPAAQGIPAEIEHLLKDRASWEEHYKSRYQWSSERVERDWLERLMKEERTDPRALHCGSLFGHIRDVVGLEGVSYLYADDPDLYKEIVDTMGDLCFHNVEQALTISQGTCFDYAHFWEDICFKNGPLVVPSVFAELVGPHYKKITDLVKSYGINIISLDCDGVIDSLLPIWLENGVNTMFPIEVGTWNASLAPWREKYGKELRGVGGMDKKVFAFDRAAIDAEVERLKPLVDLGGYIPCMDHRIPPDAKWELVQYYCDRMRAVFG